MRINQAMQDYLANAVKDDDEIYLFGSRADDKARGGDIDIFILSKEKYDQAELRKIKIDFMQKFGWQKLDLLNWQFDEYNSFRDLIEADAVKL